MLPWNYGFHWTPTTIVFMGAFYTVVVIVASTLINAALRSRRALRTRLTERIRWAEDFHDLPARDRQCRHALTGELTYRECPHAFDCRECDTHAKLIANRPPSPPAEPEEDIFGMSFPLDRVYHRGHTWVHTEPDGAVTVGLDDLGRRILGDPDRIDLPQPGARVSVNGTAWRASKRNADVRILSPVDGEVIETGGSNSPWVLRIRPDAYDFSNLLGGSEIRPWVMREMERLQLALSAEGAAPTLADGGIPVQDIAAVYPQADWDAVCGEMFLET
jgi:glycine cleavage system H lipoate-binding protein